MKNHVIVLALALALPLGAHAASNFSAQPSDIRVRTVQYTDDTVVRVVGYEGSPTVIEFGKSETVDDVAGGGIIGWDVAKVGNRIFISPLAAAKPGTVIVATSKHSYVLDVVPAHKGTAKSERVSKIMFSYDPPKPSLASDMRDQSGHVRPANKAYSMELVNSSVNIQPSQVFDDGKFTYFFFPKNTDIPVIYKAAPGTHEEWLTNFHKADSGAIVVHGVSQQWNLRLGKAVVGVFNEAFTPSGNPASVHALNEVGRK